jgi:tRNA A-37 threonylcarbamoyl transferase component Bud32
LCKIQNINGNATQLIQEHRRLYSHHEQCNCGLIANSMQKSISFQRNITGFVFGPVGEPVNKELVLTGNKISLKDVLMALYGLHIHKPPIYHGDPRLPNLILHKNKLIWIDLIKYDTNAIISSIEYARDMNILIKSIFPLLNLNNHRCLSQIINAYSENPNELLLREIEKYLINKCLQF